MADGEGTRKSRSGTLLPDIPDKLYFRIGEVARLLSLPAHVLRFWESEFPHLRPVKGGTGQRLYRRKDIEALAEVKSLLYDRGYTIAGARQNLAERPSAGAHSEMPAVSLDGVTASAAAADALQQVYTGLQELSQLLWRPVEANSGTKHLTVRRRSTTMPGMPSLFAPPMDEDAEGAE